MEGCINHKTLEHIFESVYHEAVSCGKVEKKLDEDDLEELRHLSFHENLEGEWDISYDIVINAPHLLPLKLWKHNIRTNGKPKLASIVDYWVEKTTKEIFNLLREYEDMFPFSDAELKGINGYIWEMKIMLKPYVNLVKYRPYRLNLRVKEKVKKEIEKMLARGIIFLMDEVEWVSLMLIQNKKDSTEIQVYVDYCSLNNSFVHDSFPTPFSDEALDNVVGNEA